MLYVRNLMLTTTEQQINDTFACYSPIERVKKIRDYAFVHFQSREGAIKAMDALNGWLVRERHISLAESYNVDCTSVKNCFPHSQL